jgi:hypothetical protein
MLHFTFYILHFSFFSQLLTPISQLLFKINHLPGLGEIGGAEANKIDPGGVAAAIPLDAVMTGGLILPLLAVDFLSQDIEDRKGKHLYPCLLEDHL